MYWYQHIGNLRSYIFSDVLKRVLLYDGFKVNHVMNVTDVGHLTSDADEGEDKLEEAAKKEGKKAKDIANYYLKIFKSDFEKLNILTPNTWCKATEHIKEQIELIKQLEKKGYTYKTADGIYFDSSKFKDYGKLAKLDIEGLQEGKRVCAIGKKNKTDFALWKFSEKKGVRQQEWVSPWGLGFPGWHIECSAMSMKYLGKTIDIHTGGIDHIPVHHTNEIAQSEAATGKKFVNYWMHGEFLTSKGEKISKSKGGLYTIEDLEKKGYDALVYRYLTYSAHYRKQLEFSFEGLDSSKNAYERLKNICGELKDDKKVNNKSLLEFSKCINDDLDMPGAVAVLWGMLRSNSFGKYRTIKEMDKVLGLDLLQKVAAPNSVVVLAEKRLKARKDKDWKKADELRDEIKKKGYVVDDNVSSYSLKRL